ncbi:PRELI domain containing protein 3A-like [Physella acuta]|uniref:PRELI domain containing protein 3A-like n=1 Tax=Physella acuta TaxID=109671 RepID=UPI0027DD3BB4|nr:PRELI domain containing protein 3A-like [Physella acuta]
MRIWNSEHTFNHSWDTVVTAVWRKYPNPHNPSVVGLDVLDRSVDNEGRLKTHRLMSTSWGIPIWVTKLIGMQDTCFASEHSTVDPNSKTFTLRTKNVTLAHVLTVNEELIYTQHPTDPTKTLLRQEATVTVSGLPLCNRLEQMVTDAMSNNASKGRQAIEHVIDKIKKEARDFSLEAQKCMDNVLPKSASL